MPDNKVGQVPEFTDDGTQEGADQTAPQDEQQEELTEDKRSVENVGAQSESEEEDSTAEPSPAEHTADELTKQVQALAGERQKILDEIKELRGDRRELKQKQLDKVEENIEDELKDLNPQDVELVDKILRSKGYVRKDELQKMQVESAKQDALDTFLEKYPEYKTENDPNDTNWSALQRELEYYRMPDSPKKIRDVLEKAHRNISRGSSTDVTSKKQRVSVASHGSGGSQTSSEQNTGKKLTAEQRQHLSQGGWTEEEISNIEK